MAYIFNPSAERLSYYLSEWHRHFAWKVCCILKKQLYVQQWAELQNRVSDLAAIFTSPAPTSQEQLRETLKKLNQHISALVPLPQRPCPGS